MNPNPNAAAATAANEALAAAATENKQAATLDAKQIRMLLGLPETATDAEVEGKIGELMTAAGEVATVRTELTTATTSLTEITAARDALKLQYEELWQKQEALDKQQRAAEADAALEPVKSRLSAEQLAKLRELYISSPDAAKFNLELLTATATPPAAAVSAEVPPKPTHDPGNAEASGVQATEDQIAAAVAARVKAKQSGGDKRAYSAIFAEEEKAVRAAAAAGQSLQ